MKQIKYSNCDCEYTKLGLLTIPATLKSARVHTHTRPYTLSNTYLIENDQVSADFTGNVLINSRTFRFKGILTWGRFEVHTD